MMKTKMTGGIVTYNNEDSIEACIQSIFEYTDTADFELWIYDNCSTDGTVALIEEKFPQVHLMKGEKNLGFGGGHNQIVKHIHSTYHAIINPDIVFDNDVLGPMAEYMESHPETVQLTPQVRNMDDTIQHLPLRDPNFKFVILSKFKPFRYYRNIYTRAEDHFDGPVAVESATGCFSMVRVDTFKKIHGYDRRFFLYFEDADISRRLRKEGQIVYHPELHVKHAWKRDNTQSLRGIFRFLNSMRKYNCKWRKDHD